MKTQNQSISDVLAKNATSFFIPPFQRAYAWGKPEIERYFADILRIINSELDSKQHDKLEHFFGTIVIKEESEGFAQKSVIVDGQQRLTTTLLFLIALRDFETEATNKDFITQNYLKNNSSTFEDKIKLKQVTKDWDAYKALVNNEEANKGIIKTAYQLFSKLISETKQNRSEIQFGNYIKAIQRMNVAIIFLDERPFKGEDPQIIFETLNSLGKPLTLADLIRNYVLLNIYSKEQSDIYENTWHSKIEAILNENTSSFFRDYLQYKTVRSIKVVSDNNTKEIYQLFKEFVDAEFTTHNDFIANIVRFVNCYKWIITEIVTDTISTNSNNDKEIKELIRNIFHDIKTEAFKPFVLGLFECHQQGINGTKMSDEMLIDILKTIRTYLIRRRILRLTQGENKNIVLLSNQIENLTKSSITMVDLLSDMSYSMRLPNDDEMTNYLASMNFYEQLKQYSKFILGKIEENNAKVSVSFRDAKITIEHIMPQNIENTSWPKELGASSENIHKTYLHNIGNLILTEFNSEIGNKSFIEKKKKLETSSLHFRLDILNSENWDETSIKKHQSNMIKWFLETFPLPEKHQHKDNWNTTKIINNISFSPLDNDAGETAEGNKPAKLIIEGLSYNVKTWQDVFIQFIQYIKNNSDYDFDLILDNQNDLFSSKYNAIVKWPELQSLINDNMDLKSRYKTFDGKVCDKVENLTDDKYFIHINASANSFMDRIANIMNKFNIPATAVEITLK
ncbi:MAG: DUF262 domain-containing HNH endonuclease family protein [Dysgonamonadaceae bacterium]|jgi:uncharacterized protein with ParB-like and HNH nuclease domain|nr:DUF262 domain-containing HNH endonuclease family protein [Dysgonamonadaceae bacterium]